MYSYSRIKEFDRCPKLYLEKVILKSVPYVQSPEAKRGDRIHKAFEEYVRDGKPLPDDLIRHEPLLYDLAFMDGQRLCEYAMAVNEDGLSVPYYDPSKPEPKPWNQNPAALIGGKADYIGINESPIAIYVDYKTGKGNYPDVDQCELMAYLIMAEFQWIKRVDTALLFVDAGKFIERSYLRTDMDAIFEKWLAKIYRIEQAIATNVWQRKPNNLCGWCPVTHCPDYKAR